MFRTQLLLLIVFAAFRMTAQYASVELSEENIKRIAESSKSGTLHVVINNEKDAGDAALVNAIKKFWKIGPYKFMSKAEFVDQKMQGTLPVGQLYLYEWLNGYGILGLNALQLTEVLNQVNTGFFQLSLSTPYETKKGKTSTEKKSELIDLQFDLSSTMTSNKDKILDGYFDLMVKYFNNEISFCQGFVSPKEVKTENKDGFVYFGDGLKDVQSRDILLVKEQVNKMKPSAKKENKKVSAVDAVAQFNPPPKNVYTVFPDDIKLALEKGDKQVLLYTNNMLISANNGAVVAAPGSFGVQPIKKDYAFWLASLGIMLAAFGLAIGIK